MEWIESNALIFMIVLLVYSTLVSVYNIGFEIVFRNRKTINYKTYPYLVKMYDLQINYINIFLIAMDVLLSLFCFGLFIGSRVVRIYLLALIPILFSMGFFLYLELTREKYNNRSVLDFNGYYSEVNRIEKSKTRLYSRIDDIEKKFEADVLALNTNLNKYNSIVPNDAKYKELQELVEKTRQVFKDNKSELTTYNSSIIGQFNESLSEYVIQGLNPTFEIQEFTHINIEEMKLSVAKIRNEYETYIQENALNSITGGKIKKAEQIIELLNITRFFNVMYSSLDVLEILKYASKNVSKKDLLVTYLSNNRYLTNELLFGTVLDREWTWCFNDEIIGNLAKKDLILLYQTIIEKNAQKCCNKILKINSVDQTDVLEKVLANTLENNACVQLIRFHKIVINNVQEFDEEITKYENMAYSIRDNVKGTTAVDLSWINNICTSETFYENRKEIERQYQKVSEGLAKKYAGLTDVLMCYYEGELSTNLYVDATALMNYYMENMKTLNDASLKYFNLLISAVILVLDKSQTHIAAAISSIENDDFIEKISLSPQTAVENGKTILRLLINNKAGKIVPIINRTECVRQSLDKLRVISK